MFENLQMVFPQLEPMRMEGLFVEQYHKNGTESAGAVFAKSCRKSGMREDIRCLPMQSIRFCNTGSQSNRKYFWSRICTKIKTLVDL